MDMKWDVRLAERKEALRDFFGGEEGDLLSDEMFGNLPNLSS